MQPVDHLIAATLTGDHATVRRLVTAHPDLLDARSMFGVGAVHAAHFGDHPELLGLLSTPGERADIGLAAELGHTDLLRQHLRDDPHSVHHVDGRGATPLHGAAYWGQVEAVDILLAAGADPNTPSRDQFLRITPLGSAIATTPGIPQPSDHEDVVMALVRLLLEHGADVDAARKDGMTALHSAAWRGLAQVVQELLDAGADPSRTAADGPHRGQTPADTALSQGHLVLAARLDTTGSEVSTPYGS